MLGTPGGDAGEFILATQIYSDMMGQNAYLSEDKVLNLLKDYLVSMKQSTFYMATDDQAVYHLEKELNIVGLNITRPKSSYVEELLLLVVEPENTGDLHIKLLLTESSNYSVNKTLVQYFIKAFY
jgi:hypothetical protein